MGRKHHLRPLLFGAALVSTLLMERRVPLWVSGVASAIFVLGLSAHPRRWLSMRSGQIALGLLVLTLLLLPSTALGPRELLAGVARFNSVIMLLVALPFLRLIFVRSRLDRAVLRLLGRVPAPMQLPALLLSSWLTAFGLSFGTIGVLGASLHGRSSPEQAVPGTIMRGVVLSMLLGPTTGSVAVVMASFPRVTWGQMLILGVPLAMVGLLLGGLQKGKLDLSLSESAEVPAGREGSLSVFALLTTGTALLVHLGLGLSIISSICIASVSTCLLWLALFDVCSAREAVRLLDEHLDKVWVQLTPEISLFLTCGLMTTVLQDEVWRGRLGGLVGFLNQPGWVGLGAIVAGVPLLTVSGIHPMVPFSVLSSVVTASGLGLTDTGGYTMWIVVFMLSMLVSPVSVLNLMTASSFGLSPWRLSIRAHGMYAGAYGAASVVVLRLLAST